MSIGDLNNDKLNDLVMMNAAGTEGTVYYFDESTVTYSHSASFTLPTGYTCDGVIPTAIPDPLQDLILLVSKTDATTGLASETKLLYYKQADIKSSATSMAKIRYSWTETASSLNALKLYPGSHPMALDVNGDQA